MECHVDLRRPPGERWRLSAPQAQQAAELMALYERDLGLPPALVAETARPFLRDDHWAEMVSLAAQAGVAPERVVGGNLHYDALKAVLLGCTGFAVDTADGPLHARNLDWWTENAMLSRYTMVTHFAGAPAGNFLSVGWPGFAGVLSGMAPGRFAVTLNAVISQESLGAALPVVFLLRTALEECGNFDEALMRLAETPVASDALLLLTGTRTGEMAVIERTPSRSAVRHAIGGAVFVTNDYRVLASDGGEPHSELRATSCARYDRVQSLARFRPPRSLDDGLAILSDPAVKMGITMQQMAFRAATGERMVRW